MSMEYAGEASGIAGEDLGRMTHRTFVAVSKQCELNMNLKMLRAECSESPSALRDRRSGMQRKVRQQPCNMAQLYQTVDKMARLLQTCNSCDKTQWLVIRQWMEDWKRM